MIKYKKLLVTGGSGYVASRLIPILLSKGYQVRAASRSVHQLKERSWSGHSLAEVTAMDVFDEESLLRACQDCDVAYYFIHSMNSDKKNFAELDRKAAKNFLSCAQKAKIKRIIYLGGLTDPDHLSSHHLQSRQEVSDILHSGSIPVTTLRAAMVIGTGSASYEILSFLVRRLPVMITPRWVNTESQPIAISNLLRYLSECLEHEETKNDVFDIGGKEIVSYKTLMEIYAQEYGLMKRLIIPVPVLTPRLSSYWIHLVTPIQASLAQPLAEGLSSRVVCLDQRIKSIIPQKLLSSREAIRRTMQIDHVNTSVDGLQTLNCPAVELRYPSDPTWADHTKGRFGR